LEKSRKNSLCSKNRLSEAYFVMNEQPIEGIRVAQGKLASVRVL